MGNLRNVRMVNFEAVVPEISVDRIRPQLEKLGDEGRVADKVELIRAPRGATNVYRLRMLLREIENVEDLSGEFNTPPMMVLVQIRLQLLDRLKFHSGFASSKKKTSSNFPVH